MDNPWKLATIGLALTGVTATATGLTTAYMLRPVAPAESVEMTAARPVVRHYAVAAAPERQTPAPRPSTVPITRVSTEAVPARAETPADCATATDRAMRIAKPGAIGALLGAGLGAAGGAIADGGKAAGKAAAIGGITGAVLGAGYGAYKTKNECGTVFGPGSRFSPAPVYGPSEPTQAAFGSATADGGPMTVYSAR